MKRLFVFFMLTAAVLTACGTKTMPPNMEHGEKGQDQGAVKADSVKVLWTFSELKPQAKKDTVIQMHIQNNQGKPIENFDLTHEKKLHLIVVSKDLSYFNHIHPDYKEKGLFDITTQFPTGGDYKLFADFVPSGSSVMTKSEWVKVEGEAVKPIPIQPDSNLTKVVEGKEVSLVFNELAANKEIMLTFTIKDEKIKKPITNLQQYLGAVGHVVTLTENAEQYLHVHPMEEKATGPEAKFMTTFPKSGVYKIWGQFQHENKVFVVPFVVRVP